MSFDTYNLLHRWMGRIVVAVIIHTVTWAIPAVVSKGWEGLFGKVFNSPFIVSGFFGGVAMTLLLL